MRDLDQADYKTYNPRTLSSYAPLTLTWTLNVTRYQPTSGPANGLVSRHEGRKGAGAQDVLEGLLVVADEIAAAEQPQPRPVLPPEVVDQDRVPGRRCRLM